PGDRLAHLLGKLWSGLIAGPEHGEDDDSLPFDVVRNTDRGGFLDCFVRNGRRFDFGRTDPLAGDLERVIGATANEPGAIFGDLGPVAVDPDTRKPGPVGVQVSVVITPESLGDSNPRLADD